MKETATSGYLERQIPKEYYKGVLGDRDKDSLPNADDVLPDTPSDVQIEEVRLSDEVETIIDYRNEFDIVREDFFDRLRKLVDACGKEKCSFYSRTKTPYSIINKLRRRSLTNVKDLDKLERKAQRLNESQSVTALDLYKGLTDVVGTMVVMEDYATLSQVAENLRSGVMGKVLEEEDFYSDPLDGYRAVHFLIGYEQEGKIFPIEVQLKTRNVKIISDLAHTFYKQQNLNAEYLEHISEIIYNADQGDKKSKEIVKLLFSKPDEIQEKLALKKYATGGSVMADGEMRSADLLYFPQSNFVIDVSTQSVMPYSDGEVSYNDKTPFHNSYLSDSDWISFVDPDEIAKFEQALLKLRVSKLNGNNWMQYLGSEVRLPDGSVGYVSEDVNLRSDGNTLYVQKSISDSSGKIVNLSEIKLI